MLYLYLYAQCMPYVHEKYQKILMKPNSLVLHVIQLALFGLYITKKMSIKSMIFFYSRLAFLPIYFTAHETGRHQVIETYFSSRKNEYFHLFSGPYINFMHNDIAKCFSCISLSIFAKSLYYNFTSRKKYAVD